MTSVKPLLISDKYIYIIMLHSIREEDKHQFAFIIIDVYHLSYRLIFFAFNITPSINNIFECAIKISKLNGVL
ncbi:hypothetical protein EQV76_18130 [Salmonella enterica]|nr:hypothetical protein [Salmonella enterica]